MWIYIISITLVAAGGAGAKVLFIAAKAAGDGGMGAAVVGWICIAVAGIGGAMLIAKAAHHWAVGS